MQIPVKHPVAPRPNKICNEPPDIPERGQHGYARDSNNLRDSNTRHGHGYRQEVAIPFGNRYAFQPVVQAETPLPPGQGSGLSGNRQQSLHLQAPPE